MAVRTAKRLVVVLPQHLVRIEMLRVRKLEVRLLLRFPDHIADRLPVEERAGARFARNRAKDARLEFRVLLQAGHSIDVQSAETRGGVRMAVGTDAVCSNDE